MQVLITSFAGDAGKTTLSKHLLRPRLTNPYVVAIEHKAQGNQTLKAYADLRVGAGQFQKVVDAKNTARRNRQDFLLDLGVSDARGAAVAMANYPSFLTSFDIVLVPHRVGGKVGDALSTCDWLMASSVPVAKIIVIQNAMPLAIETGYETALASLVPLFAAAHAFGYRVAKTAVDSMQAYEALKPEDEDASQYAASKMEMPTIEEGDELYNEWLKVDRIRDMASAVIPNLDAVWNDIVALV